LNPPKLMIRSLAMLAPRSISFSGAGFMGSYHCGVIQALQEEKILPDYPNTKEGEKPSDVICLGSSAGALVSAGVVTGISVVDLMNVCHLLSSTSRKVIFPQIFLSFLVM